MKKFLTISYLKSNYCTVLFILLLLSLVIYKLQFLNLPYFWDESWVYAPSLRLMHDNGPSLMPNVIPVEYSRGHPLLFHFLGGIWLKVFGSSFISLHSFALLISVLVIVFLFLFTRSFFNERIALFTVFLMVSMQMFIAQSAFVYPEMMLTLWMVISVFTFFKRSWLAFILSSTALLLTKESGLALIATYFFYIIILLPFIDKSIDFKERLKLSAIVFIPVILAFLWFLLQRFVMGWFLFPDHIGMMTFKLNDIFNKISSFCTYVFNREGRVVLTIPLLILFLDFLLKKFLPKYKIYSIFKHIKYDASKNPFIAFVIAFMFIYFVFSSLNFFTLRYLLIVFPLFFILISYYINTLFEAFKYNLIIIFILLFTSISFYEQSRSGIHECNHRYVEFIHIQQQLVDYLKVENKSNQETYASFVFCTDLKSSYSGYVKKGEEIFATNVLNDPNIVYFVYNNMECMPNEEDSIKSKGVDFIKTISYGKALVNIYKKKQ